MSQITREELAEILADTKQMWEALAAVALQVPGTSEIVRPRAKLPQVIDMVFEQAASASSEIAPPDLMAALRAYEQADHDGVFVTVSREALDKAIELLASPSSAEQFKKPFSPDGAAVVECAVCNGYGKVRLGK